MCMLRDRGETSAYWMDVALAWLKPLDACILNRSHLTAVRLSDYL